MNNSFRKKLLGGRPRSNSKLEKKGKAIEKVLVKRKNTVFGGDLPSKPPKFLMQALLLVQQHGSYLQFFVLTQQVLRYREYLDKAQTKLQKILS
jgi:hypothetical protein